MVLVGVGFVYCCGGLGDQYNVVRLLFLFGYCSGVCWWYCDGVCQCDFFGGQFVQFVNVD